MHLVLLKVTNVSFFLILPKETPFTIKLIILKPSIICACARLHYPLSELPILNKLTSVSNLFFIIVQNSISMHETILKLPLIYSSISPFVFSLSIPFSRYKVSIILISIIVYLLSETFRDSFFPFSSVLHLFFYIMKSPKAIKHRVQKVAFV